MGRFPDFVVIGAMKCATSTLHDQLALQPGIFMSSPKEPNFFSDDPNCRENLDTYKALFERAGADEICGESSTHYTKRPTYPMTVDRMKEIIPDAKLIYVMRDPLARLTSHYIHDWTENIIRTDINQAVRTNPGLVDYGRYSMQLKPFFEAYGPRRMLPVFFERLIAHPQAELERICEFIGYRGHPVWAETQAQSNVSRQRLRKSRLRDTIVYAPIVSPLRETLVPQRIRNRIKGFWQMRERPALSPHVREQLEQVFEEDLATLGHWLGIELHCGDLFGNIVSDIIPRWNQATLQGKW